MAGNQHGGYAESDGRTRGQDIRPSDLDQRRAHRRLRRPQGIVIGEEIDKLL